MFSRLTTHTYTLPLLLLGVCVLVLCAPQEVAAQIFQTQEKFTPIAGIPGLNNFEGGLGDLVNALYRIAIVAGALAAVLKITVAGVKYMGTDVIGSKGEAKEDIKAALLGLLILLSTVLILKTIFGEIRLDSILTNLSPINTTNTPPSDPNAPPPSGQRGIVPADGCSQGKSTGQYCSGASAYTLIGPNGYSCHEGSRNTIQPLTGQTTFRPITRVECLAHGGDNIIRGNGSIFGYHTISRNDLQAEYPGKSVNEACVCTRRNCKRNADSLQGTAQRGSLRDREIGLVHNLAILPLALCAVHNMKKILISALVVIIFLLGGAWAYLLINGTPESVEEIRETLFGSETTFPTDDTTTGTITPFEETPTNRTIETSAPLIKITTRPIAGGIVVQKDQGNVVRYIEKGSGNIYEISLQNGEETMISQKTISGVVESHWSPTGKHAVLVLDAGGARGDTLLATLSEAGLTIDALPNISNEGFSLDGTTLYYTEQNASLGTTAFSRNLETGTILTLFTTPFAESAVLWDRWNGGKHYVYTRPASGLMGYLYRVEKDVLTKVDEAFQLTASRQDGDTIIVNRNSGEGPYSLMLTLEDGRGTFLSVQTLREKCARSRGTLLCAANNAMNAQTFPLPWYQGTVSYTDTMYRIDRTSGESTAVADLEGLSREQIDVTDIAASDSGHVLFRNKRDDSLWLYNPPQD